jgi:hypothetical protein
VKYRSADAHIRDYIVACTSASRMWAFALLTDNLWTHRTRLVRAI